MPVRKKRRKQSKAQVRAWLQTPEGQCWLENKKAEKEADKSLSRRLRLMSEVDRAGKVYDCSECLHGIGRHCTMALPRGCLNFFALGQ